jgi:hypothetical protein
MGLVQTTQFLGQHYAGCEGTMLQAQKFRHENIHENKNAHQSSCSIKVRLQLVT